VDEIRALAVVQFGGGLGVKRVVLRVVEMTGIEGGVGSSERLASGEQERLRRPVVPTEGGFQIGVGEVIGRGLLE